VKYLKYLMFQEVESINISVLVKFVFMSDISCICSGLVEFFSMYHYFLTRNTQFTNLRIHCSTEF